MTYKEVASTAGSSWAFRAVGNIMAANRDLAVPCHRVIRSDGSIGGYNRGIKNKAKKLKEEGLIIINGRVKI
jgi:O-6-methylguanine DNA methyltransferase